MFDNYSIINTVCTVGKKNQLQRIGNVINNVLIMQHHDTIINDDTLLIGTLLRIQLYKINGEVTVI